MTLTDTLIPDWVSTTNIYEVNLRQYTKEGTFKAFARHLPRLKDMGVEVIWFMPVTPISIKNRKVDLGSYYACSSYVQTNPEFGTMDEFKWMVDQIHGLGMKVIIDWVANHTGWDHEWTIAHPEFYNKNEDGTFKPPVENWEDVIHLNFNNTQLREAMIDAMKFWVDECNIDGFRCDMAMLVPLDFWLQARKELDAVRPLFWLGEFDQWGVDEPYARAFDVSYSWHWMHISETFYRNKLKLAVLDDALVGYQYKQPYHHIRSFFTSNHDENSWNGTEYEKYGDAAIPFAVFSCMWNGSPLIYSGQEIPNQKRLAFFDKDEIKWKSTPKLHHFYQTLLRFRKQHPALKAADRHVITWRIATTELEHLFSFVRKAGTREVITILNFSNHKHKFHINDSRLAGSFIDLFTGKEHSITEQFIIPAWGYLILHK
jgi:alpha-amylase